MRLAPASENTHGSIFYRLNKAGHKLHLLECLELIRISSLRHSPTSKITSRNFVNAYDQVCPLAKLMALLRALTPQALEENAAHGIVGLPQTPALLWQLISAAEYLHGRQARQTAYLRCPE